MKNFLNLPAEIIETIEAEGLFQIKGGQASPAPTAPVNNQGRICEGTNNQGVACTGINNQGTVVSTKQFCERNNIKLLLDFTTNATLIDQQTVDFLKTFTCSFQITLDGDRERHNQIKVFHSTEGKGKDTYQATLDTLRLINENIPDRHVAVRINFDNKTLQKIDTIIQDIAFLDRKKSMVILKKVWQVKTHTIDHSLLLCSIQKFFDTGFLLDYYVMPKGCVCFADKESQVLFNYDGKIFKCTTISHFDDNNALGHINKENGEIVWKKEKFKD